MNDTSLARCAVAFCSTPWHKMGEGKLFLFHVRAPKPGHDQTEKVWLCENCFESWNVSLDREGEILLSSRQKMATSAN